MNARKIDRTVTLPLGEHGVDVASGPDGTSLTVFTDGWPDGRRIHFNIWVTGRVREQLATIQQTLEAIDG